MGAALRAGAEALAGAGIPDPRAEATALWAGLFGGLPGDAWLQRDREASAETEGRFREEVRRRVAGEPLAYVAGWAGFRTLTVRVDRRVLIPRPETEGLVERVLVWGRRRGEGAGAWGRAVDVGTGSGCIALSLAVEGRFLEVVATDSSGAALEVARANVTAAAPPVPVTLREGAFFAPVAGATFAAIVANPPYLTAGEFERLESGVRDFEPREALVAGESGLEHLGVLLAEGRSRMEPGGLLALEVDCARAQDTLALAREAGWGDARIERDLYGRERYLLATGATSWT